MEKENDIVLNMLANPEFGVLDFQVVGLKAENTELKSEDDYKKSEKITGNDLFKDANGQFDEAKFHKFYMGAGYFYNKLSQDDYNKTILEQAQYSKDNMWVAPQKRTIDYSPKLVRLPNEHLINSSLTRLGKKGKQTLSDDEIAQTLKVYDVETGEWSDSPNDSFFSNFFTPLVRAEYDLDEYDEQGNLLHSKGELKLNEDGLPYYETLGGRNISGKRVLNKMNILTKDGSTANKFDFFDSDDIDLKNAGAAVLKNAALVGSMFLPYVGPVVTGLSVLSQTAGLIGTFGKMISNLSGADDAWANELEGWAKSVNRSATTLYAAENTWCWENFFNLIGDSVAQLQEQRWIFKAAPALLKGPKAYQAMSNEGREALVKKTTAQLAAKDEQYMSAKKIFDTLEEGSVGKKQLGNFLSTQEYMYNDKAYHLIDDLASSANKIGAPISKAYMVGLTVGDTYQEAKDNGATDLEAALLTIGYAAAETALLNSELGEWILPELHNKEFKNKAIAEALMGDVLEAQSKYAENKSKKGLIKSIVGIGLKIAGKEILMANLTAGSKAARMAGGMVMANALGESFEEVSEEALADASKAIFNVSRWLRGQEGIDWHEGDNITDRYLQSALGGFIGGGIASAGTDFVAARNLASMDKTKAMQELLYMVNNNMEGDFLKSIDKLELGNKHLSAKTILDKNDESGQIVWAPGNAKDNQDLEIKKVLKNQVKLIKDILDSEGARLSTSSLINNLTLEDSKHLMKDMRFNMLQNSATLGLYLQDYQNIQNDLVRVKSQLNALELQHIDSGKETALETSLRQELTRELGEIRAKKDAYVSGQMAPKFIRDAIYEMNPVLHNFALKGNLQSYTKFLTGKNFDELSDTMKEKMTKEFETYQKTEFKDDVHAQALMFDDMIANASPVVEQFKVRMQEATEAAKATTLLYSSIDRLFTEALDIIESEDPDEAIDALGLAFNATDDALNPYRDVNQILLAAMNNLPDTYKQRIMDKRNELPEDATPDMIIQNKAEQLAIAKEGLLLNLEQNILPIIDLGFLHPEAKKMVVKVLDSLEAYSMSGQIQTGDIALDRKIMRESPHKISVLRDLVNALNNTPILEFISLYQTAATNSKVNIMDHWKNTIESFDNAREDISDLGMDEDWESNNEEVLKVMESFGAVVSGMRADNADFGNITSYSKIMNEVSRRAGVQNPIQYSEIDEDLAVLVMLDLSLVAKRFGLAGGITAINKGQKLKQQTKVGTVKNHLLYNAMLRLATTVLPDDDDDDEIKGGKTLKDLIANADILAKNSQLANVSLSKSERLLEAAQMMILENGFYDFFEKNKNWSAEQLGKFLSKFAGPAGFFNRTGLLLTEKSTALDDNAFIWWMAARAAMRSTDFHSAYNNALDGELAAIPSQELATYLGVASVTNMGMLNKFIDAYKQTVVKDFKGLSEADRIKYLNNYKGTTGSTDLMATRLLDYFAGHDAVPQYHNMIFIEGGPGTGKSKGVYKMVINTLRQIDPEHIDGAMYVHATAKSAAQAANELGLTGETKSRELFLQWISSEWKDARLNKKDGKSYLYDDSYEFTLDGLVNKWKLNAVLNPYEDGSTTPKVIFIDEISHYNQLELSMIEQFARLNQIVVLTAGDLNQDTFTCWSKMPGVTEDVNVTISRNNFIRTPKLGVSLRTLNKQMTGAVRTTQSAFDLLASGENARLEYNYHENDADHPGLFGVKVLNPTSTSDISDSELQSILPTIDAMVKDLKVVDGELEKIGYIYSSSNPDTKLHKYLTEHYADKVDFFADSDAQGLEGKYYIVDLDRSKLGDANISQETVLSYLRSLYTGITRAEKGVLAITPGQVGNIEAISSIHDPKFQEEDLGTNAIKKSADERKEQLDTIFEDLEYNEGITPNELEIVAPEKFDGTPAPSIVGPGTLPAPFVPPLPPVLAPGVYANKADADLELSKFMDAVNKLGVNLGDLIVQRKGSPDFTSITSIDTISNVDGNYLNLVTLADGLVMAFEEFVRDYTVKTPSAAVVPIYSEGQQMVIKIGTDDVPVKVDSIDTSDPTDPVYSMTRIDDGTVLPPMKQSDIIFVKDYIENEEREEEEAFVTGFENEGRAYEEVITNVNLDEDDDADYNGPRLIHKLYTHAAFETGVEKDASGNIKPYATTSANAWAKRIDSMIGLSKLKGNTNYDQLMIELGLLKNYLNTQTRSEVAKLVNDSYFDGKGVTKVDFAFKSSHVGGTWGNDFDRYQMAQNEELQYILSQDPKAKLAKGKKLVAIFNHDGKNVLEIPIGILNSPLTIAGRIDPATGNNLYMGDVGGKQVAVIDVFKLAFARTKDTYLAIDEVLQTFLGQHHLDDLMDLFKVYRYTSNGIFYLPKTFELSKQKNRGPELIDRTKGKYQLNDELYWDRNFEDLAQFADHVQHNVSSLFMSKDGKIAGKRIPGLHPGHSFVLVSDDNSLTSDKDLVSLYEKLIMNPAEPKKVKLYYVVPPKAKISSWLINLHNIYRNRQGETLETWHIGNNFTSYNVLKHLIESGHFDDPDFARPDNVGDYVKLAVADLQQIEKKWNQRDITFEDNTYNGKNEKDWFEYLLSTIGDENARRTLMLAQQSMYLRKKNNWGLAIVTADKTIELALNTYLTNMIWPKPIGTHVVEDPIRSALLLDKLDNLLKDRLDGIYYRAKYGPASDDVGSFQKVVTKGTSGRDKYALPSTLGSESKAFRINDKIDTPTFTMDEAFSDFITDIARHIQYNGNHWYMTGHFANEETNYLQDLVVTTTNADVIKSEYADKFNDGTLNVNLLDPNKSKFQILVDLAADYSLRAPNQWGFVHNGQLVLTKFTGPSQLRFKDDLECVVNNADQEKTFQLVDSANNPVNVVFWFDVDNNGFIKDVKSRCTDCKGIKITTSTTVDPQPFTAEQYTEFLTKIGLESKKGFANAVLKKFIADDFNTLVERLKADEDAMDFFEEQMLPKLEKIMGEDHPVVLAIAKRLLDAEASVSTEGTPVTGIVAQNGLVPNMVLKTPTGRVQITRVIDLDTVEAVEIDNHDLIVGAPKVINDYTNVYKEVEQCATINWSRI